MNAFWQYDSETDSWKLIYTASRTHRLAAVVESSGNWQTFDMDGAGGESSHASDIRTAQQEAEESLSAQGYL